VAHAIVDLADLDLVSGYSWSLTTNGYVTAWLKHNGRTRSLPMGRLILGLDRFDPRWADHRDGNRLNHRRGNLRAVTPVENARNRRARSSTGYRNVHKRHDGKYEARVVLGAFATAEEAHAAVEAFRLARGDEPAR
jgi:hypothetical protein